MDKTAPVSYPRLDLDATAVDAALARRIPYALARYYLALPLGQDDGCVSVAMAYPDNLPARLVLERLLQARVAPVFTPVEALRPLLESIYSPPARERQAVLAWCAAPESAAAVCAVAVLLSGALHVHANILQPPAHELETFLESAASRQYEVAVLPLPSAEQLSVVLGQSAAPLFFVRGDVQPVRRILAVLRGFASDEQLLDWLPLLAAPQQAQVTLLPISREAGLGLGPSYRRNSPPGHHLERCLATLQALGTPTALKHRLGAAAPGGVALESAVRQVVEEVTEEAYDLLVLAAEADGDFVSRVITAVDRSPGHPQRPIFVLKPRELSGHLSRLANRAE